MRFSTPLNKNQREEQKNIHNSQNKTLKYPFYSYKNFTDNQGWLPVKIDFTKFKPKPYFKDSTDYQIEQHLQKLQKKQELLKRFKYWQDFDRIDYGKQQNAGLFEMTQQKVLFSHLVMCAIFSRIYVVGLFSQHYSASLWWKASKKLYLWTLPIPIIAVLRGQASQPINHQYFRSLSKPSRMYLSASYDLDAYQYVNDTKYNFKYPQREEYYKTVDQFTKKRNQHYLQDSIEYFKKYYGIVDSQPYLKNNGQRQPKSKTKQNKVMQSK